MNPAALKTNVEGLKPGGLIIADEGEFGARNLAQAGYDANPLEDDSLARGQLVHCNISQPTLALVKPYGHGYQHRKEECEDRDCRSVWNTVVAVSCTNQSTY